MQEMFQRSRESNNKKVVSASRTKIHFVVTLVAAKVLRTRLIIRKPQTAFFFGISFGNQRLTE